MIAHLAPQLLRYRPPLVVPPVFSSASEIAAMSFPPANQMNELMQRAVDLAWHGVEQGESPFAALIVDPDGEVVESAYNHVRSQNDPSAHAEVLAIRHAARKLGTTDLAGLCLISTGEPCPMCAATAAMAKIGHIVFGASASWIAKCGYETLDLPCEKLFRFLGSDAKIRPHVQAEQCQELLARNAKS